MDSAYPNSWALVIGINAYQKAPRLNYAVADAESIARLLPSLGFPPQNIRLLRDQEASKAQIERVLYRGFPAMGPDDRLLVYFAGHGETEKIKGGEEGFLLPVDVDPESLPLTAIAMDEVKRIGQRIRAKHVLFVVDACFSGFAVVRDMAASRIRDEYLVTALREPVVQIMTAGRKGELSIEEKGHGLFTRYLLEGLRGLAGTDGQQFVTVAELANWVEPRVVRESRGRMTPQYGKLEGEGQFIFIRPSQKEALSTGREGPERGISREVGAIVVAANTEGVTIEVGRRPVGTTQGTDPLVVTDLPPGRHSIRAVKPGFREWTGEVEVWAGSRTFVRVEIEPFPQRSTHQTNMGPNPELRPAVVSSPPLVAGVQKGQDRAPMVFLPPGGFTMGANAVDRYAYSAEKPSHTVELGAVWIDQFEVTNAQYKRFRDSTRHRAPAYIRDPRFYHPDQPIVGVSWEDALSYCRWAGKRLPTEAEWEKAARGVDGRLFPWGSTASPELAHIMKNSTVSVGAYPQGVSPYGVLDMAGNVWEWVHDWFDATYYQKTGDARSPKGPASGGEKVLRGGSWWERDIMAARSTARHHQSPDRINNNVGFRCALSASEDH